MALRETNLIPLDILNRRFMLRHLRVWTVLLVICVLTLIGVYYYQTRVVMANQRSLTALQDIPSLVGAKVQEVNQIQEELEKLDQQRIVLRSITRNQPYAAVLSTLASLMHKNTWLTQLTIENGADQEHNATLKLVGYAFVNEELAHLLKRLAAEPMFDQVFLKLVKEAKDVPLDKDKKLTRDLIYFQIECEIPAG
jgi:Tfp pilus assembly protein PilN